MKVVQTVWGKFHHFHLARQLQKRGMLETIVSTYPRWKLGGEGIPMEKVRTFPWVHTFVLAKWRLGWRQERIDKAILYWNVLAFDRFIERVLPECDVLVALSGSGVKAGPLAQRRGGAYICDRGSSHIRYADELLRDEFLRWGQEFPGVDPRHIAREEFEYDVADAITVPSEFARKTFVENGVSASKIKKIPYGADLHRFSKTADPSRESFDVLFVGQVSFRKGVPYLLEAFSKFRHPRKKLTIVGAMQPEMRKFLGGRRFVHAEFVGPKPHSVIKDYMSKCHVLVLPSIEEGLAIVQGEAMACGCPVMGTTNTGAEDLFTHGEEGFILPIRDPAAIANRLEELAQDPTLRQRMSEAALIRVRSLGGWDTYGEAYAHLCEELVAEGNHSGS
jgi:starch synthase